MRWTIAAYLLVTTYSVTTAQTTYYVASTGNDANDGRSAGKPLQSLAKVNSLSLQAGDAVLFRRGDTFRGSLLIRRSGTTDNPIRYDAYGNGSKPLLTGSVPVSGWVSLGSNRWQASCPECDSRITNVFRNGIAQPLGRYPNADAPNRGSLTIQANVGAGQLTSQEPLTTDWTGAEVVLRPTYWIIDRATISRQVSNTLTLNNPSMYVLTPGWGYFIQNHPQTLDQRGEWYYNPNQHTLQLYLDQGNPNEQSITATTIDQVIDVANSAYITIQNLHVAQARTANFYALNASNLTLRNADFSDSGEDGVLIEGAGETVLLDNCTITTANNNGFFIGAYRNVTVQQSTIRQVGLIPGRGKSGDGQYTGFQSQATQNTLIQNNVIDSIGYCGITIRNNTTIRRNVITNFCITKSDGGGIYLFNAAQLPMHNIRIQSNIIRHGIGTYGSLSDTTYSGAHGVFLDDCVQEVDLFDNTIADCHGLGIYMHSVSQVNLLRNTCFNNSVSQLILYNYDKPCLPRNNVFHNNVLIAKTATQPVAAYISSYNDLPLFGSMESNYYARPFNDLSTIRSVYNYNIVNDLNVAQWQDQFGLDRTSRPSPLLFKEYRVNSLTNSYQLQSKFDNGMDGWDLWSLYNNGRVTWRTSSLLDGGSLQIDVSTPSSKTDSYLQTYKPIQAVAKAKKYLLRFDAAAASEQKITVFLRQRRAPYQDLSRRYEFMVGPTRTSYEFALTPTADDTDALLTFQLRENSQPSWFDNIYLQEANITLVNPDDAIRLVYNPTERDSTVVLNQSYRDVKNHYYSGQLTLSPFSSVVLLRDTLPPVDISLSMQTERRAVKTGTPMSVLISLHSRSAGSHAPSSQVQWACQLPTSLTLVSANGLLYKDGILTGTVQRLLTDTTFIFKVKSATPGQYSLAAEVTTSTYADPTSSPNSGTDDGEDDTARITFLVDSNAPTDTTGLVTATEPVIPSPAEAAIYPNPSSDGFTFMAEADIETMQVIDLLGREMLTLGAARRGQQLRFGQQLPSAYYLLHIRYKTGAYRTMRLVKR